MNKHMGCTVKNCDKLNQHIRWKIAQLRSIWACALDEISVDEPVNRGTKKASMAGLLDWGVIANWGELVT